jgi:predicted dehydrogenase
MKLRIAFAGFRHMHILELYELARKHDGVEVVASCEPDCATREQLAAGGAVEITHDSYDAMWDEAAFDALAVGEYYGGRAKLIVRALGAGQHVIVDKPVCTRLADLDRIAELASGGGLAVGCMLTMRDDGNIRALRELVRGGRIGEVHTICFSGQHPLMRGERPEWYFQPDGQGGTINDIAIHAVDAIPWITGRRIVQIVAARAWNARVDDPNWFQDGAQVMFRLDNDGGVIGDVSYRAPDVGGYAVPQYWRLTLHGSDGIAETATIADGVMVYSGGKAERVAPAKPAAGGYFEDFLAEVGGKARPDGLTTRAVLASSRLALLAQRAADESLRDLACE